MLLPGPISDALDLVLGRGCACCDRPGAALCADCLTRLRGRSGCVEPRASLSMPLPPVTASLPYAGSARQLILDYKEHGNRALAPMLAILLADAIVAHAFLDSHRACTIVPVPAHRRSRRGFDALGDLCTIAGRVLTTDGRRASVRSLLRANRSTPALKSLTRGEREAAVVGSFRARGDRSIGTDPVLVVDDVLTTGSTVTEAVRALASAGIAVDGIAVIANATRH